MFEIAKKYFIVINSCMKIQKIISFCGTKVNAIYYNDSHGQIKNIGGFLTARDEFFRENQDASNLTLSSGDVFLDKSKLNDTVASELVAKTDAVAIGNHELGSGEKYFKGLIEKFGLYDKFVTSNVLFNDDDLKKRIAKSKILTKNGERIGVIALSPSDFSKKAYITDETRDINIQDFNSSLDSIKEEVRKLEKQGINKIFLLAHTGEYGEEGENYYDKLAEIGGIDVIIGGHDHREVNRMTTSMRNEPVVIVSTGRSKEHNFEENLDYYGTLELEFDDDGVLDRTKSRILKTPKVKNTFRENVIFSLSEPLKPSDRMVGHSEIGNLVADSNLWYVNEHTKGEKAAFAFVNAGTIRDEFESKDISEERIISVLPFTQSKLIKTELTKAQIMKTLEHCAKSTVLEKIYPGAMQVSGMEYTICPDLSVKDVHIINPDGSIKYNLDDCPDDAKFPCVYDTFLLTGVAGLSELKKDLKDVELFNVSRQEVLKDYLLNASELEDYRQIRIKKQN